MAWGGNMTLSEFNKYMDYRFDQLIEALCPKQEVNEDNKMTGKK